MTSNIPTKFTGEAALYYGTERLHKVAERLFRNHQLFAMHGWPRDPEQMADIDEAIQLLKDLRKEVLCREMRKAAQYYDMRQDVPYQEVKKS